MKILALETSCDETGAAVVASGPGKQYVRVLSNTVSTSLHIHAKTGGIIPENAAREQVKYIFPVIIRALTSAFPPKNGKCDFLAAREILKKEIDAIAITQGPGLIGSLLVGVETAKTLSYIFKKPLVPVNHLLAHLYANFIEPKEQYSRPKKYWPKSVFPFIGLIVSGGHTDLLFFKNHNKYVWLGGTRDDAAGEALDKIGRLLGLSYPAGPEIEKRARTINENMIKFKSPMLHSNDFDFSFSGLKTEVLRYVKKTNINEDTKNQICAAAQDAIIKVLVTKTIKAAEKYNCHNVFLGGGVSANEMLLYKFQQINKPSRMLHFFSPEKMYSTDNAAMIGAYALLNFKPEKWKLLQANPELYFA